MSVEVAGATVTLQFATQGLHTYAVVELMRCTAAHNFAVMSSSMTLMIPEQAVVGGGGCDGCLRHLVAEAPHLVIQPGKLSSGV